MGDGDEQRESKISLLWSIATGKAKRVLDGQRSAAQKMDKKMDVLREGLQRAKIGPMKNTAMAAYQTANNKVIEYKSGLNRAIRDHNDLAEQVSKATLGAWNPGRIGMAAAPLAFAAAVAVILIASAVALDSLTAWFGKERGILGTTNNAIDKASQILDSLVGLPKAIGEMAMQIAVAGVGLVIAYSIYKGVKGKRSAPVSAAASPATAALKEVEGRVAA
jgi:hypothetical protein